MCLKHLGIYFQVKERVTNKWNFNPSKSEVIGHSGGDEKPNDHAEPTKVELIYFSKWNLLENVFQKNESNNLQQTNLFFWHNRLNFYQKQMSV